MDDPVRLRRLLIDRLTEVRSAHFTSWVSLGEADVRTEDLNATGTTDFVSVQTRSIQRPLSSAVSRDGAAKAKTSLLNKVVVGGGLRAIKRLLPLDEIEYFFCDGQPWQRGKDGSWGMWSRSPTRPGSRNGSDPALVLKSLPAIFAIDGTLARRSIHGTATTGLRARADLSVVEERFVEFLEFGDTRRRARDWVETLPVKLWVEDSGLLRRISYAPLAPNTAEPFWWTLELFDFGSQLQRPVLPKS